MTLDLNERYLKLSPLPNGKKAFYTKAADRALTEYWLPTIAGEIWQGCDDDTYYNIAHETWKNLMNKVGTLIRCYGGQAPGQQNNVVYTINGAMNAQNPEEVHVDYTESVNAQSTKRLMQKLLKKNKKNKRIYLISDNALYYKNKELAVWIHK